MKTAKNLFLSFCLLLTPTVFYAQAFTDGTNLVSIGFGLPPGDRIKKEYDEFKNFIDYKFKNYGTIVLKYEHGLNEHFGLGLNMEYSGTSAKYKYDNDATVSPPRYEVESKNNILGFYARMNGHFPVGESFDMYGGVGLGYLYTITKNNDTNPNTTYKHKATDLSFDYQVTLGARYMVKENVGLFGEIGWATTLFQLGVALKF